MKLVRAEDQGLLFSLGRKESATLRAVLSRYPCVPAGHQKLSRGLQGPAADENQSLLDEALAAQREENQRRLAAFLAEPGRFKELKQNCHFRLTPGEAEWLLQVLNDVRVGCWIRLGSPDFEAGERVELNEETGPHLWIMEAAAHFESGLLDALDGG